MNKQKAEEIIENTNGLTPKPYSFQEGVAKGYLEGHAGAEKRAEVLVEALEKLYSIIEHKRPAWPNEEMRWIKEAKDVLDKYHATKEGDKDA